MRSPIVALAETLHRQRIGCLTGIGLMDEHMAQHFELAAVIASVADMERRRPDPATATGKLTRKGWEPLPGTEVPRP